MGLGRIGWSMLRFFNAVRRLQSAQPKEGIPYAGSLNSQLKLQTASRQGPIRCMGGEEVHTMTHCFVYFSVSLVRFSFFLSLIYVKRI